MIDELHQTARDPRDENQVPKAVLEAVDVIRISERLVGLRAEKGQT